MTIPLLDWASANPWLAFGLSFPTAMVIVSMAWLVAASCENAMNLILRLVNQVVNGAVILFRGYAPMPDEPEPDEQK
jgi:hypothetical protein